ncbi:type VII secretion integral membrane protein EccD [Corynebacterium sp. H127]|uniref:type VII secretion integral membrane protein EccD n=1 Tax=Corynebacterium sp. H127 TaxID=3133418 RepID=UPI0030A4E724
MTLAYTHVERSLRLSFRIELSSLSAEDSPTSVDVSVPASSSLAEALPEILDLASAPVISVPWMARTAGGQEIDHAVPLGHLGLSQGAIVVLSPFQDIEPVLRKDAAESLGDLRINFQPFGLATSAATIGLLSLGVLAWHSTMPTVPVSVLFILLTLVSASVTVWLRFISSLLERCAINTLTILSSAFAGISCWLLSVGHATPSTPKEVGWAAISALLGSLGMSIGLTWLARPAIFVLAGLASFIAIMFSAALGAIFVSDATAAAACAILASMTLVLFSPSLSTALAGLTVPRLPSAGQDLKVADQSIPNPEHRAQRATDILDGICLGTGTAAAIAVICIGWRSEQPGFALALSIVCVATVALHATRHRSAPAMWGLWLWLLAGLVSATLSGLRVGTGGVLVVILIALAAMSAPLWAARVRDLPPTALNWLEKLEALSLAAAFPLAAHLAGVFAAIRGLG